MVNLYLNCIYNILILHIILTYLIFISFLYMFNFLTHDPWEDKLSICKVYREKRTFIIINSIPVSPANDPVGGSMMSVEMHAEMLHRIMSQGSS